MADGGTQRGETEKERIDRELMELLNELRVALPGVEVLFAFLLILPFTDRFTDLTGVQRATYYLTFLCTAVAVSLFIAPTAYHRLRWRRYDKERLLLTANRQAIAGLVFLALSVSGAVFLVSDMLFGVPAAAVAAAALAALVAWNWFALPILRARTAPDHTEPRD